jgi:hypothetical protein
VQAADPDADIRPAAQLTQLVRPAVDWYIPAAQLMHAAIPEDD